jgi:multidrug resistance efflux pump
MGESHQKAMLRQTLELLDASQQGQNAAAMGSLLCHELARRFGCTRVSIGLIGRGDRLRVVAVSGTDRVDRKGAAAESIEAAMEECAAQDIEVVYPAPADPDPGERRVTRAHDALSKKFGPSAIMSLPLRVEGDLVGVALLEREAADPFPPGSAPLLRLVAEFIGPAMWTRRLADRGIWAVARDRAKLLGAGIVGPRHTGSKLAALALLAGLAAAAFIPLPSRVVSEATIEASSRRTIMPPFTGYLAEVRVRPGDPVVQGDVLARMDTLGLELERDEATARRDAVSTERDDALARGELDKVRTAAAQMAEIDARLNLIESQLSRSAILSPISGQVAQGDQRDFVGARVESSSPLFEVIEAERLVALAVDERDITRVREGQRGWIAPRARPDQRAEVRVVRINPVAQAENAANVYRVEAEVVGEPPDWLRPGATATGKLEDGTTTALAMFLRPIVDEIRLNWWW